MVTFQGDPKEAAVLLPERTFEPISQKGEIGVTNMSRPNHGIIGIRLDQSEEFGPTGEERYGTNIGGRMQSDIGTMLSGLKEGDIVYMAERKVKEGPAFQQPEERSTISGEGMARPAMDMSMVDNGEFKQYESPSGPFAPAQRDGRGY